MLYRLNRLFNVSRGRAALVAVLCFIAAFSMVPLGADFFPVYGGMFVWSPIYGCIWFHKYQRDQKIIRQSKPADQQHVEIEPEMTTPGSHHLFVPKPLERS